MAQRKTDNIKSLGRRDCKKGQQVSHSLDLSKPVSLRVPLCTGLQVQCEGRASCACHRALPDEMEHVASRGAGSQKWTLSLSGCLSQDYSSQQQKRNKSSFQGLAVPSTGCRPTPVHLATQPLPAYPEQLTVYSHTKTCEDAVGSCVYNDPNREVQQMPFISWINKLRYIQMMDKYLVLSGNGPSSQRNAQEMKYIPLHARSKSEPSLHIVCIPLSWIIPSYKVIMWF